MLISLRKEDIPKGTRTRKKRPAFELSEDWAKLKAKIDAGISGENAELLPVPPEFLKSLGLANLRTISKYIQRYVKAKKLPYSVTVLTYKGLRCIGVMRKNDVSAPD